ncbi:uncharacterized protein TM35_000044180 [Trypanosoma theileri]|uniref:Uncharacterized protein n=1 Tax=Trypanosoma theileri TaxID=67003 RepID=A0A1X0P5H8_9TRYP|nr:uncharacterized protein TM35_000044180 [Trypanosoma theileri]ORC92204.1 hypothetical protein TM35_000044180 [Trypanosoma theileri]
MVPVEADDHSGYQTPPPPQPQSQCDAVGDILTMKSLSPHDKVREFVDQQQQQQQHSLADTMDVLLSEELQDTPVLTELTEPVSEQTATTTEPLEGSQLKTKKKIKPQKQQQMTRKRKQGTENGECDDNDKITLFRRSQKALRKEARHVNIKEILCRSLGGIPDASSDVSNPFSPTGVSQTSSTWSPSMATSITNHFLSNVQQQKKQTFERLLQKEMTNSQLSFSRLTPDDGNSSGEEIELIIGDETAIMEPPNTENDILIMEDTVTSTSIDNSLFGHTTTSRGFVEMDEEAEQAQSEALMRKHELWRLRQKHLREKLRTEEAAVSQGKSGDHHPSSRIPPSSSLSSTPAVISSSSMTTTTTTTTTTTAAVRGSTADVDGSFDVLMMAQRSVIHRSNSNNTLRITADHMDMIRRANNFNNTSSQRVVVFEARGKNRGNADSSSSSAVAAATAAGLSSDHHTTI